MNILLVNQNWFAEEFRAAGHDVIVTGFGRDFEVKQTTPLIHVDSIVKSLPRPFDPDLIIAYDESSPLYVTGLNETSIPTIFYSVDTHHHAHMHAYVAHVFDETVIAQKDYASAFEALGIVPHWLPLWASRFVEASQEKQHDVCFIGNMDRALNPERVNFFEALQREVPMLITQGEYWRFFPHSEVVVNQTVKGDLNFRVFEAMMCGPALLTERQGNGLLELFREDEHLITYEKNNVKDAREKIEALLADRARCRRIANAGREEILARHLPQHRAETILELAAVVKKRSHPLRCFGALVNFSALSHSFDRVDEALSTRALVAALRAAEEGVDRGEPCTAEIACHLVRCALNYDRRLNCLTGYDLIRRFDEAYPQLAIFTLARLRFLLNRGERDEALKLAAKIEGDATEAFVTAERVISSLLQA